MITIQSQWEEYRPVFGKAPLLPTEAKELRQTFYAGFWMGMMAMAKVSTELPEAEAVQAVQRLSAEAEIFLCPKGRG